MFINLDWQPFEVAEEVTCEVRPLELWALQKLMGLFQGGVSPDKTQEEVQKELEKINPLEDPKLRAIIPEVLPKHARNLEGLEIKLPGEEQRKATIEDLSNIDQLMLMSIQILMKIFSLSTFDGGARDNIKKQSPES